MELGAPSGALSEIGKLRPWFIRDSATPAYEELREKEREIEIEGSG
jgi:hypothetical protein